MKLVLIASRGAEPMVAQEASAILGREPEVRPGSVHLVGSLEDAYRLRLGMRTASRLLTVLSAFEGTDGDAVYAAVSALPLEELFSAEATFSIEAMGRGAEPLHFLTLRAKDAVVDRFRARSGRRPNVDKRDPDARLHLHLHGAEGQISLDVGDGPLSHRGYRPSGAAAPLRESLAATLLVFAEYPEIAERGGAFIDPMCGSGTLVIEAAAIAARIPPGLSRPGPRERLAVHDARLFSAVRQELEARRRPLSELPVLLGRDLDGRALQIAREAARRAGVLEAVRFEQGRLEDAKPPEGASPGLVLVNPPYGERLGDTLRWNVPGYQAGVFTADETLSRRVGLKPKRRVALYNGPLPSVLSLYEIHPEPPRAKPSWKEEPRAEAAMFENRLKKNLRRLEAKMRARGVEAYRIYDRDIPEYAFAIDRYGERLVVQEWAAPSRIDPQLAASRARDVRLVLERTLDVAPEHIHFRRRRRRGRFDQVASSGGDTTVFVVSEAGHRFEVELAERLDTGLYLDHRELRRMAAKGVEGARFLNLFAYTGTASVYAAKAGAKTVSVDLSRTYLDWAERNFRENGLNPRAHAFLRTDVIDFLEREQGGFAVIFCNPPSYSRSTGGEFDVKRDHARLIRLAARHLEPGGRLYFSTHARGFELDPAIGCELEVEEISQASVPPDFRRDAHRAYLIRRR